MIGTIVQKKQCLIMRKIVNETMISETEGKVNIIRKTKYKVGQKFMVEMREGYHLSKNDG